MKNKTEKIKLEQYYKDFKARNLCLIKYTVGNLYFILTKIITSLSLRKVIWQHGCEREGTECK